MKAHRTTGAGARVGALVLAGAVTAAGLWAGTPERRAAAEPGAERHERRGIAPGVTHRRIRMRGPVVVHLVRVDPAAVSTIDVAPASARLGRAARTSAIGRAHGAAVAINGDFGLLRGTPLHPFQVDGATLARGLQVGTNFAMHEQETASYFDPARLEITASREPGGPTMAVAGWNSGPPAPDTVSGYTPYGGDVFRPPPGGCSVRLERDSALTWGPLGVGHTRRYRVDAARCGGERRMRRDPGTVVLASRRWGAGADALAALEIDDALRLSWSLGWQRVADTIGGMPRLVDDGVVVAPDCRSHFCRRHPRTGVGVAADGTILLVVVDGRSRRSVGMTLRRFGRTFAELGAVDAVNLDGGGSTTMWIAGRGVVNRPSDPGGERSIVNALLVLPGADDGGAPSLADVAATSRALVDPGSTGGLAEAWLEGSFGAAPAPPAAIRRAADRQREP